MKVLEIPLNNDFSSSTSLHFSLLLRLAAGSPFHFRFSDISLGRREKLKDEKQKNTEFLCELKTFSDNLNLSTKLSYSIPPPFSSRFASSSPDDSLLLLAVFHENLSLE